jgi:hypothetical protein
MSDTGTRGALTRSHSRGHFDRHLLAGLIVAVTLATVHSQSSEQRVRPRAIVTTDPELDDSNSLVRFLLYSSEVETEGLITSFQVPTDATPGQTIYALIQVTDNGTPELTSFQRVIVTVAAR